MTKGIAGRFRNITNATKPWVTFRRRQRNGEAQAPDIHLKPRGRWKRRSSTRRKLATAAVFLSIAAGVVAVSVRIATSTDSHFGMFYLLPFALVGIVALWCSKLSYGGKLLWSVPLVAWLLAFVP